MASKVVRVDVISDTVCPWCFVGKTRLEKAIQMLKQKRPEVAVEVHWRPYQLDPTASTVAQSKRQVYIAKFGEARVNAIMPMMAQTFQKEGMPPFTVEGMTGSTFDSHRLIHWAGKHHGNSAQNKLVDRLFRSYFCEAQTICDREVLVKAAEAVGLQGAREFLESGEYAEEVKKELRWGMAKGVRGVPHFIFENTFELGGAQEPDVMCEALEEVAEGK
eukprot:GDKI01015203.1.p1 GENE.GDKI01015203.1~~GDKI01015203.1.p1  ORF type:complete len:218 (-),score=75.84 GDKI01015203.1:24-677(-)